MQDLRKRGFRENTRAIFSMFLLFLALSYGTANAIRLAVASGNDVIKKSGAIIDVSNSSKGYIMVKRESKKKQALTIKKDKKTYQYYLNSGGSYETFPLQMGSGKYEITVLEQKSGSQYTSIFSKTVSVKLESEETPFLYPSKYINYDENSSCIALSNELCEGLTSDLEKFEAIRDYVRVNIMYDYMMALSIVGGDVTTYVPDLDAVLENKKGICFDFAALMAAMLRAQDIPTKLVMGYADTTYHAWNHVYIGGKWGQCDVTFTVTNYKPSKRTEDRYY